MGRESIANYVHHIYVLLWCQIPALIYVVVFSTVAVQKGTAGFSWAVGHAERVEWGILYCKGNANHDPHENSDTKPEHSDSRSVDSGFVVM